MKFKCYDEDCSNGEDDYTVETSGPNARAEAAVKFCIACAEQDWRPANVIVEPADDEARALPGWMSDGGGEVFVCILVEPSRRVTWVAEQVRGFNPYGSHHGPMPGGERARSDA